MIIFLIIGIILGALVVIFALQNLTAVTVVFLAWQIQGSLAIMLVLAVLIGMFISTLFSLPRTMKKSMEISALKKHNENLKDEVANKNIQVEVEKSKLAANNAYLDNLEKTPKI